MPTKTRRANRSRRMRSTRRQRGGSQELINAADRGDLETVKEILANGGVKIDYKNKKGNTALIQAIRNTRIDVVEELLNNGANPNLKNGDGETPIFYSKNGYITSLLLEKGAEVNVSNKNGVTLIESLAVNENVSDEILKKVLAAGAEVEEDSDYENLIERILMDSEGKYQAPKILLLHNSGVKSSKEMLNKYAHIMMSFPQIVMALLKMGADPNNVSKSGYTLLLSAIEGRKYALINTLLQYGAKQDIPSLWKTPSGEPVTMGMFIKAKLNNAESQCDRLQIASSLGIPESEVLYEGEDANSCRQNNNASTITNASVNGETQSKIILPAANISNSEIQEASLLPKTVFEPIMGVDVETSEYLEDPDSAVFVLDGKASGYPKSQMKHEFEDGTGISYECKKELGLMVAPNDVTIDNPYYKLQVFGGSFLIPAIDLAKVVGTPHQIFELKQDRKLAFTAGRRAVSSNGEFTINGHELNIVGMHHCQAGTDKMTYTLTPIRVGTMAGGKHRKTRRSQKRSARLVKMK